MKPEEVKNNLKKVTEPKLTDEQLATIERLKTAHKLDIVFALLVGDKVGYLRKPNRKDIAMAQSVSQGERIPYYELILDSVWLEGDEVIKTNDDYFLQAMPYLDEMFEPVAVHLKKN